MNRLIKSLLLVAALAVSVPAARATTVIPPTFDELVGQAEFIFQGKVTNVRSQWVGEGGQRHIATFVTFQVEDSLKGAPGESYTIRVFGGTVGEDSMGISDAPTFQVGDDEIVFVEHNGSQLVPLVGMMHGQYRVQKDASGREIVVDHENHAVRSPARMGPMTSAAGGSEPAMDAAQFKAAVRNKLQATQ